jgi:hypothetical protein
MRGTAANVPVERRSDGERSTLIFVRHIRDASATVWARLTDRAQLCRWPYMPLNDPSAGERGPASESGVPQGERASVSPGLVAEACAASEARNSTWKPQSGRCGF